jgi:putative ABC transport system ATP-binding protein
MFTLTQIQKVFMTEDLETAALSDINLRIEQGDFLAIMGPSGCGKSTLLNILGLLDQPSSGEYEFAGQSLTGMPESQLTGLRRHSLSFVFQSFNLIDELTVFENIELPLVYQGVAASERQLRVSAILQKVALAHRAGHRPQQLSGGQQQRVAIARALVSQPKLILADEPTGNLDSVNRQEVMTLLQQLNQEGATIVMVTHSEEEACFANKIIRMRDGKIVPEVQAREVRYA